MSKKTEDYLFSCAFVAFVLFLFVAGGIAAYGITALVYWVLGWFGVFALWTLSLISALGWVVNEFLEV